MQRSYPKARHVGEKGGGGGTVAASLRIHRRDPLALPVIDRRVTEYKGSPKDACFALALLDAGMIDESATGTAPSLILKALTEWVNRRLGDTPALSELSLGYSTAEVDWYGHRHDDAIYACIDLSAIPSRFMEPRFDYFEERAPGLYRTAFDVMEKAAWAMGLYCGTPMDLKDRAAMWLWFGMDNQEDVIEELLNCDIDPEDWLTPDRFMCELPTWIVERAKRLPRKKLRELAKARDAEVAELARLTLRLAAMTKKLPVWSLDDEESVYPIALLRWNQSDNLLRCYDELIHRANETQGEGTTTLIYSEHVPFDEMPAWIADMNRSFEALALINQLVACLSVEDDA